MRLWQRCGDYPLDRVVNTRGVCPRTRACIFCEGLTEEESATPAWKYPYRCGYGDFETVRIVLRTANTFYREANKDKRVKRGVSRILDKLYMMVLNWDAEIFLGSRLEHVRRPLGPGFIQ